MKNKFSLSLAVLVLTLFVHLTHAQSKLDKLMTETTPEERAEMQSKNMQEILTLSEHQYHQVHEINLKYARKMQSIYNTEPGKLQRLKSMKAVSEDKDKEMKRVLNSSQYELYREQKEEMKENAKERRKNGPRK